MSEPLTYTLNGKTDMKDKVGYAVYINVDAPVDGNPVGQLCTAAEPKILGIIKDGGTGIAKPITVVFSGRWYAVAGALVRAGKAVTSDADGKLVEAADGETAIGTALTGASEADKIFQIFVDKHNFIVPSGS